MAKNDQKWTTNYQKIAKNSQNGNNKKLTKNGQKWPNMTKNDQKWQKKLPK